MLHNLDEASGNDAKNRRDLPINLGKYKLIRELSHGGAGIVYEGEDLILERRVAVKLLPLDRADASARSRLLAEARAAARLNHPNAVAVYDAGEDPSGLYIAMELIHGTSAHAAIRKNGPFSWPRATRIAVEVCQGLSAAHAAGMIHRDIKPANIMLADAGRPESTSANTVPQSGSAPVVENLAYRPWAKLADFGLSRSLQFTTNVTLDGQVAGTPNYMSPEQIRGEQLDERTDIYSLGATYFTLLTGHFPYERDGVIQTLFAHCSAAPPDPQQWDSTLPIACSAIIARAMAKEPRDRFRSVENLLVELRSLLATRDVGGAEFQQVPLEKDSTVSATSDSRAEISTLDDSPAAITPQSIRTGFSRQNSSARIMPAILIAVSLLALFTVLLVINRQPRTRSIPGGDLVAELDLQPEVKAISPPPALAPIGMQIERAWGIGQDGSVKTNGLMELMRIRFCPDHRTLAWGISEGEKHQGRLTLFDIERRDVIDMYTDETPYSGFNCVAFPSDHIVLLACNSKVITYDRRTHVVTTLMTFSDGSPESIDVSPDGRRLAVSVFEWSGGGRVELHDLILGSSPPLVASKRQVHQGYSKSVRCVIFSGTGEHIASAGTDGIVLLCDGFTGIKSQEFHLPPLQGEQEGIGHCVAFSPDSQLLAAGGRPRAVLWNVKTGAQQVLPEEHRREIMSLAFTQDGACLATGSTDGIRFWNVKRGSQIGANLDGHGGNVISGLVFTADNSMLISCGYDSSIRFWNLTQPGRKLTGL
ncbi:MAG: serine/threonine protein kinase [Planctomycetaceae bacterium]|nr:serine/threonine protein kinase [Planctomycetaceae bacterium]